MKIDTVNRIIGGTESQVVVGAALFTVQNNMRGYAVTVRVTGTIIAAIQVQDQDGIARAYTPTWLGITLYQGDNFVSQFPIVSMTLTGVTDSVIIHCDKPY